MKRQLCIHGHFYQPPRENAWLEAIEYQDSAYPHHDWNERISTECYTPNSASRILDAQGKILKIVNNYSRMSFNFGPTLLAWLEKEAPDTYLRILEADEASSSMFSGHGSAIAQAYNHMIMPLANSRDKRTQVIWGLRDFSHRFGREPEGMWLPETAVDTETLEILSEYGIRFTILEPGQAGRIRRIGEDAWVSVAGGSIDTTRPYLVRLASGRSISVFFYDGPISRAVAFEKLLSSAATFIDRLTSRFDAKKTDDQLVHITTDGETFGHHHPHGDMALAWALDRLAESADAKLTIYGEYLELHPPEWEVQIIENTSWSCSHGIERWRSNCGCQTGGRPGWTQAWRAPLREAFDWLRDEVSPHFERRAGEFFLDPWKARDDYISVILDRSTENVDHFLERHRRDGWSHENDVAALQIMELQRHAMLMYTSCGWFFNEVSGIETLQVIHYAGRVLQLAEELFEVSLREAFLERLRRVSSNLPEIGDAGRLFEKMVQPAIVDLSRVAAHYAVSSLFESDEENIHTYSYETERLDHREIVSGRAKVVTGRVRVTSRITRASNRFTYGVLYMGDLNVTGGIRPSQATGFESLVASLEDPFRRSDFPTVIRTLDRELGSLGFSIKSLFRDEQRRILASIWKETMSEADGASRLLYDRYVPLMRFHAEIGIPLPVILRLAADFAVNMSLARELERETLDLARIRSLISDARVGQFDLDHDTLGFPLKRRIAAFAGEIPEEPEDPETLEALDDLLQVIEALPFRVDFWPVQNAFYTIQKTTFPAMERLALEGNLGARRWIEMFLALADRLQIHGQTGAVVIGSKPEIPGRPE